MAGISQTNLNLSVIELLGKKNPSANAKPRTSANTILDKIRETDPANADALEKKLDETRQVIAQLKNGKSIAAQSKKAAAAEKIKRIKAEIQMLKTMGGDPKLMAKQIARLARELASAVREYASAGQTSLQNGTTEDAAANASGNNADSLNAGEAGTAESETATPANVPATTGTTEASTSAVKDVNANDSNMKPASASTVASAATAEGAKQYQETQQQKFKDDVQKEVGKIREQAAKTKADDEFALEARTQAALLKVLARQVKQRLSRAGDHSADADLEQTRQALAEVEKSLSEMTGGVHLTV